MNRQIFRLFRIARVMRKHGLDEFLSAVNLWPWTFLFRLWPVTRNRDVPRGERLRLALEELGPIFVKFGQILSTRPDLLADDIARSLTRLQDQVPPFPGETAIRIVEQAYGDKLENHFRLFETEPTASASVAQVHYAELHDGAEVVVKVIRPGIEEVIDRDLALLHTLAGMADRYWSQGKRLKPREIVSDYDKTIHDELNLMREAASASKLKSNFRNYDLIHVPTVYWEHTRRNVMVMERIRGIPIRDTKRLKEAGIDMRKLAHTGVEIFFTQAFRDGFFHADMHPGNIFVSESGQYRAVDFGIMGTLSAADKRYLAENLLAFFNRDYHRVAEVHVQAGWVPPTTQVEEFEGAIRTVCEPVFSRPISEISFGNFLVDLFRVARRFDMPIQPQLVLLQKTILNIEGIGRQLYPELDLWETAKPFLEKWMNQQIGPRAAIRTIRRELPNLFTLAPELPGLTHQLLHKMKNDDLVMQTRDQEIKNLKNQMTVNNRKILYAILGMGLVLLSVFFMPDRQQPGLMPVHGWILLCSGLLALAAAFTGKSK